MSGYVHLLEKFKKLIVGQKLPSMFSNVYHKYLKYI